MLARGGVELVCSLPMKRAEVVVCTQPVEKVEVCAQPVAGAGVCTQPVEEAEVCTLTVAGIVKMMFPSPVLEVQEEVRLRPWTVVG